MIQSKVKTRGFHCKHNLKTLGYIILTEHYFEAIGEMYIYRQHIHMVVILFWQMRQNIVELTKVHNILQQMVMGFGLWPDFLGNFVGWRPQKVGVKRALMRTRDEGAHSLRLG